MKAIHFMEVEVSATNCLYKYLLESYIHKYDTQTSTDILYSAICFPKKSNHHVMTKSLVPKQQTITNIFAFVFFYLLPLVSGSSVSCSIAIGITPSTKLKIIKYNNKRNGKRSEKCTGSTTELIHYGYYMGTTWDTKWTSDRKALANSLTRKKKTK